MVLPKVTERWVFPLPTSLPFGLFLRLGCGIPSLEVSSEVMRRRLVLEILRMPRWSKSRWVRQCPARAECSQHSCQYVVPVQFLFLLLTIGLPPSHVSAGACGLLSLDCCKENWMKSWMKSEFRKSFPWSIFSERGSCILRQLKYLNSSQWLYSDCNLSS